MVRIRRRSEIGLVAGVTSRGRAGVAAGVATDTGDRSVRPGQWESAQVVIE